MDSGYPRRDFSQLATPIPPSSNVKRAGSGSRWASTPHKARGITEVSNRNTISKDSTQSNELWALELRNRATISKDLTQSDGPFKSEVQNRGATSKDKIESDKARRTALGRGGSLNAAQMGAMPSNASPGLYAVHQPSPAQQLQHLQRLQQQAQQYAQQAQQYAQQVQIMQDAQIRQITPQMQAQIQQMARMGQLNGQMMDGNVNVNTNNMKDIAAMQMHQQQQQQQQHHFNMSNPSPQMAAIRHQQPLQQQRQQAMLAQQFRTMVASNGTSEIPMGWNSALRSVTNSGNGMPPPGQIPEPSRPT